MHRHVIVSATLLSCAAVLLAWDGTAVTSDPFESLHGVTLAAEASEPAHSHSDWKGLTFNAEALRSARAAVETFRKDLTTLDAHRKASHEVREHASLVVRGAREALRAAQPDILASTVDARDLSSHDGLSSGHYALTWTHSGESNAHAASTSSHQSTSTAHLSDTNSHGTSTNVHMASTDNHTANTTVHMSGTGTHSDPTNTHSGTSNVHNRETVIHLANTTTHANDTTLHQANTDTHTNDTELHTEDSDTHLEDSDIHHVGTGMDPPPG